MSNAGPGELPIQTGSRLLRSEKRASGPSCSPTWRIPLRSRASLGDAKAQAVLAKHHEIIRQALLAHEGREVDRAGDGFLTSFASVSQAVACAVTIQRAFHTHNSRGAVSIDIQVRIGLGAGEPIADGDALFGSAVNLTARICASADPGQILAARVVRELCSGKRPPSDATARLSSKAFRTRLSLM